MARISQLYICIANIFQNTRAHATNYSARLPPSSLNLDGDLQLMFEQRSNERLICYTETGDQESVEEVGKKFPAEQARNGPKQR